MQRYHTITLQLIVDEAKDMFSSQLVFCGETRLRVDRFVCLLAFLGVWLHFVFFYVLPWLPSPLRAAAHACLKACFYLATKGAFPPAIRRHASNRLVLRNKSTRVFLSALLINRVHSLADRCHLNTSTIL